MLLLIFSDFRLSYLFLILLLFINVYFFEFAISVFFSLVLFLLFILNYKLIKFSDFKSPILTYFVFFLLCCLPSFVTTDAMPQNLYKMLNILAFFILITISVAAFHDQNTIKKFFKAFVLFSIVNSFFLIINAVSNQIRAFGFAGIMFVDYAGIAIVNVFIWFLLGSIQKKILLLPVLVVLILASLFTQTRNSWISIFILILLIIAFFYLSNRKYGVSRRFLLTVFLLMFLSIGGIYTTLEIITPSVSERAEQLTNSNNEVINQKGETTSSLITRLFIWHTAYNAFVQNPITGIGMYAFPYISWKYNTLPNIIFENYVKKKTPHIAYLAIATETGIIGLFGYLIFIFSTIKFSYQSVKSSNSNLENLVSTSIFFTLIYITVSMLMTDAWLWNQGIILWGIVLGLSMANRNILIEKHTVEI